MENQPADRRLYFYISSGFLGIVVTQTLSDLPPLWWGWVIPLLYFPWRRGGWARLPVLFVIGMCWATFQGQLLLGREIPREVEGKDVEVRGQIISLVERRPRYHKFDVEVAELIYQGRSLPSPGVIRLRWYDKTEPEALGMGADLAVTVRLKRPHGFQNPGVFDYEKWLFRKRIRGTGYIVKGAGDAGVSSHEPGFRERIQRHLADSPLNHKGLIAALTIGDRANVSVEQWTVLIRTGTAHLLAISGLHIGLVAGFVYFATLWAGRIQGPLLKWVPASRMAAVAAMVAAFGYAALAGFTIPTQRALVMVALVMSGLLCGRRVSLFRCLMLALLVICVADPLSTLDGGFWLSFGAVGAICLGIRGLPENAGRWHRILRLQLIINLCLAPILLYLFGKVSVVSPVANWIAIPVVGFLVVPVVLTGAAALMLGYPEAGDGLFVAGDRLLALLWAVLSRLSGWEWAAWQGAAPDLLVTLLGTLGIAWLIQPWKLKYRLPGLLGLLPIFVHAPAAPPPGDARITVLDVGQGLSIVAQTANHVLVYDTGARFSERFNIGDAVVLPFLAARGIKRIDALVVSHGDNDHSGGAPAVVAGIAVGARLSSVPHIVEHTDPCVNGQSWIWDRVVFEVLHPPGRYPPAHNNASCVIRISTAGGSMLLTGDIEAAAEYALVERVGERLASDVLLVPHQGSKTSSTEGFLDMVAPQIAVVSTGYLNHYGHPATRVTRRYLERRIDWFDTARDGAVELYFHHTGISIERQRSRNRKYWFDS